MHQQIWNGIVRQGEENVACGPKVHPLQKPVALMAWCIGLLPAGCMVICDPYMGSATTGVACVRRGLSFVGIELDEEHFDTACRRIEQAYRQRDLFLDAAVPTDPQDQRVADLFSEPQE